MRELLVHYDSAAEGAFDCLNLDIAATNHVLDILDKKDLLDDKTIVVSFEQAAPKHVTKHVNVGGIVSTDLEAGAACVHLYPYVDDHIHDLAGFNKTFAHELQHVVDGFDEELERRDEAVTLPLRDRFIQREHIMRRTESLKMVGTAAIISGLLVAGSWAETKTAVNLDPEMILLAASGNLLLFLQHLIKESNAHINKKRFQKVLRLVSPAEQRAYDFGAAYQAFFLKDYPMIRRNQEGN